jgi:DNA-binding HxlR family transcriptional regulator
MMFIIYSVDQGANTFTDIRKEVGEVNTKILTDRLMELVEVGILEKKENGNYELSRVGKELSKKLGAVTEWWGKEKKSHCV